MNYSAETNEYFYKVTQNLNNAKRPLSGREKAAILFSEIGGLAGDGVINYLSTDEIKKLRRSIKGLGYNVNKSNEVDALQEANDFGIRVGISKPIHTDAQIEEIVRAQSNPKENSLRNFIAQNPTAIADALRAWMKED